MSAAIMLFIQTLILFVRGLGGVAGFPVCSRDTDQSADTRPREDELCC